MGLACSRVTVIKNGAKEKIELKEELQYSLAGSYHKTHILGANEVIEVPATELYQKSLDSRRTAKVRIFVGGRDSGKNLGPHELKIFAKKVFIMKDNELLILRFTSKWFDIRSFGFLGHFRGGDYLEPKMPANKSTNISSLSITSSTKVPHN